MKKWLRLLALIAFVLGDASLVAQSKVHIVPIREDIMPPLTFFVRRAVKAAMEDKADWLLLDMDTNGGRVDVTDDIIAIIGQFKGNTATYVNRKAFSAGAFISVATQEIYMAPQSVIGAAAPIMMMPGGGPEAMPATVEAKMTSAVRAMVRTAAEKNGHNIEVIEAMIDKSRELKIDGQVLNEKGQILTLTDVQAAKAYGTPPKPLLSKGTFDSMEDLLKHLGLEKAAITRVQPTGAEKTASWLTKISPLLLMVGVIGIYIEMKTPGFGIPGIVGIVALVTYFAAGYIAGLSGLEWLVVFFVGLVLFVLEIFFFPGTIALGMAGAVLMLIAIIMGFVDIYPGMPALPTMEQLKWPLQNLAIAGAASLVMIAILARFLPKTALYGHLVSQGASGAETTRQLEKQSVSRLGQIGVTISALRPGGKARFGDVVLDVVTQGEMIPKGAQVKVIASSGSDPVVEAV